jgi:hypothetical protein
MALAMHNLMFDALMRRFDRLGEAGRLEGTVK